MYSKQELINKKGRSNILEKEKEETTELHSKSRNKKPANTKEKCQMDAKSRSELVAYTLGYSNLCMFLSISFQIFDLLG